MHNPYTVFKNDEKDYGWQADTIWIYSGRLSTGANSESSYRAWLPVYIFFSIGLSGFGKECFKLSRVVLLCFNVF